MLLKYLINLSVFLIEIENIRTIPKCIAAAAAAAAVKSSWVLHMHDAGGSAG